MKKTLFPLIIILLSVAFLVTNCTKDEDSPINEGPANDPEALNYPFTIPEGETEWKMIVNGEEYSGGVTIYNSLNTDHLVNFAFDGSYPYGGVSWLPMETATIEGGDLIENVAGSATGEAYFNMSVNVNGTKYYAYSTDAYAHNEEYLVPGTSVKMTVKKMEGEYVTYKLMGFALTNFVGEIDALFEGEFKTKDGTESITVERGEIRVFEELPPGAEEL